MVLVGGACFLAAILLMTQMEFVMMASNYDGSITVDVAFRSGTKVEVMNQRIQTLEDASSPTRTSRGCDPGPVREYRLLHRLLRR